MNILVRHFGKTEYTTIYGAERLLSSGVFKILLNITTRIKWEFETRDFIPFNPNFFRFGCIFLVGMPGTD